MDNDFFDWKNSTHMDRDSPGCYIPVEVIEDKNDEYIVSNLEEIDQLVSTLSSKFNQDDIYDVYTKQGIVESVADTIDKYRLQCSKEEHWDMNYCNIQDIDEWWDICSECCMGWLNDWFDQEIPCIFDKALIDFPFFKWNSLILYNCNNNYKNADPFMSNHVETDFQNYTTTTTTTTPQNIKENNVYWRSDDIHVITLTKQLKNVVPVPSDIIHQYYDLKKQLITLENQYQQFFTQFYQMIQDIASQSKFVVLHNKQSKANIYDTQDVFDQKKNIQRWIQIFKTQALYRNNCVKQEIENKKQFRGWLYYLSFYFTQLTIITTTLLIKNTIKEIKWVSQFYITTCRSLDNYYDCEMKKLTIYHNQLENTWLNLKQNYRKCFPDTNKMLQSWENAVQSNDVGDIKSTDCFSNLNLEDLMMMIQNTDEFNSINEFDVQTIRRGIDILDNNADPDIFAYKKLKLLQIEIMLIKKHLSSAFSNKKQEYPLYNSQMNQMRKENFMDNSDIAQSLKQDYHTAQQLLEQVKIKKQALIEEINNNHKTIQIYPLNLIEQNVRNNIEIKKLDEQIQQLSKHIHSIENLFSIDETNFLIKERTNMGQHDIWLQQITKLQNRSQQLLEAYALLLGKKYKKQQILKENVQSRLTCINRDFCSNLANCRQQIRVLICKWLNKNNERNQLNINQIMATKNWMKQNQSTLDYHVHNGILIKYETEWSQYLNLQSQLDSLQQKKTNLECFFLANLYLRKSWQLLWNINDFVTNDTTMIINEQQ